MSTAFNTARCFWCMHATTRAIRRACARNAHAGFKDTPAFLLPSLLRQGAIGSARIASCPFAPPIRQRRRWCGALRLVVWVRAPHEKPTQRAQPPLLPALAGSQGLHRFSLDERAPPCGRRTAAFELELGCCPLDRARGGFRPSPAARSSLRARFEQEWSSMLLLRCYLSRTRAACRFAARTHFC